MSTFSTQITVTLPDTDSPPLFKIQYLGCAGFLISYDQEAILTDPFFSYTHPLKLFCKYSVDTEAIDNYFSNQRERISAILLSHTHYDHIADFPYIYERFIDKKNCTVVGNKNVKMVLDTLSTKSKFINGENQVWHDLTKSCRVLSLQSRHAPQFLSYNFFEGSLKDIPQTPWQWKGGQTLAYLLEFETTGKPTKVLFSGSADTLSKEALEIIGGEVDIAILSFALHEKVENYPKQIIKELKPKCVIVSHWDNIMKPRNAVKEKNLVLQNKKVDAFIKKIADTNLVEHIIVPSLEGTIQFS